MSPWEDCNKTFSHHGQIGAHYVQHNQTSTGNIYTCRRDCGTYWPNAYLLTTHEAKCEGNTVNKDSKIYRVELTTESAMHETPAIILIARCSSNNVPKDWFAGHETLEEGLPRWGISRLAEYRKVFSDDRRALLIVGIGVKTACTPTVESIRDLRAETSSAKTSNWARHTGSLRKSLRT